MDNKMYDTEECGRCDSSIVQDHARQLPRANEFYRRDAEGNYESDSIRLCSECLDDIWEFVFEDEIDRSDKVDPMSVDRVSEDVETYVDGLEELLSELESVNDEEYIIGDNE